MLACALIGAGLIHLALVMTAPLGLVITAPLGLTVALGALGFLEFGWGALTIAEPRVRAPRLAFAVALTTVALAGTPAGPHGGLIHSVPAPGSTLPAFNSPDHSGH